MNWRLDFALQEIDSESYAQYIKNYSDQHRQAEVAEHCKIQSHAMLSINNCGLKAQKTKIILLDYDNLLVYEFNLDKFGYIVSVSVDYNLNWT